MPAGPESRGNLLRWVGWFGLVNAGIYGLVAQRYFWYYHFPDDLLGTAYALLAFAGQLTLLAVVPLALVLVPLAVLTSSRRLVVAGGVLVASVGLSLLFLDTNVFAEQRFHLSRLVLVLFDWQTWAMAAVLFVIFLLFESMLAGQVWKFVATGRTGAGKWAALALTICWAGSQGMHIWGDAVGYTSVTQFNRFLPLYFPIHAKRDLAKLGWVDPAQVREQRLLRGSVGAGNGQLQYPLVPLRCEPNRASQPNILFVLIDALRPDAIHPELTPNLFRFRESGIRFADHFSGGNSSRMGIFSLFYGLPSTYFQSFYDLQISPVLMDEIKRRKYDIGLFSAMVGFGSPALIDRTTFAGWPGLAEARSDLPMIDRASAVTDDWINWIDQRNDGAPFFGFLYYDPPMGSMSIDEGPELPMDDRFSPTGEVADEWRRYRLAMQLVDGEIRRVLDALTRHDLWDDTIVIIASDHGYEFDDNGLGYIGHASNFSAAQLRATLMMHWPGKAPREYRHRTMHHDLPVTLLQEAFACSNPPQDYSIAENLFTRESWRWMMAGSYTAHAIVQPEQIIVSRPGGYVEVFGPDYRPSEDYELDPALIQESLEAQRRFFK
jgi:membrane-anchored protein YejM (alkaline phosphatase superfamily)